MVDWLLRAAVAIILTLGVSACQTTDIPAEKLATLKTLSVINATGNDWSWERHGFLNYDHQKMAGADWKLGDRAGTVATTLLTKQYKLIPTGTVDTEKLRGRTSEAAIAEILARMPTRPDAVLVIRHGVSISGNTVLNAPSNMIGFGVYRTTHLFEEYISAYGLLEFELFDGRSGQSLARFNSVLPSATQPEGMQPFTWLKFPGKIDRLGPWTDRFEDQSPTARVVVRTVLTDFVDRAVPFTLRQKGLIRALPSSPSRR